MTEFNEQVAARAKVDVAAVVAAFAEYGVHQWVARPPAPRTTIRRVAFSGTDIDGASYEFAWKPDTGVWAISTVENNVGKSSVLDVIRWLLSGRDHVDDVVRKMIESAELEVEFAGDTDTVQMCVQIAGAKGSGRGSVTIGGVQVASFAEDTFEEVMNGVMLPRLGLEQLVRWQKFQGSEDGRVTVRSWTSLIPAFFLPKADDDALLGSTVFDSGMLLQVYLGMPWYSTYLEIETARKALSQRESDAKRRDQRDTDAHAARIASANANVQRARDRLAAMPTAAAAEQRALAASRALTTALRNRDHAAGVAAARDRDASAAREVAKAAARQTRSAEETVAARGLFGDLRVEICPHCEVEITDDRRKAEADHHVCMVCTRSEGTADSDAAEALDRARARMQEADDAAEETARAASEARTSLREADAALERAQAEREQARADEALVEERVAAQVALARAEGEAQALERPTIDESSNDETTGKILKAASKVALERMTDEKLMDRLGAAAAQLCRDFGMSQVTRVEIDRGAKVKVTVGEVSRTFSQLRQTEKQRVRISIVVAMLRIARPVRHPGLIVIDSPADGELTDNNLSAMLKEVISVCDTNPRMQVLVATTHTEQVAQAVPNERVLYRGAGQRLW